VLDLSPDLSVETEIVADEECTAVEVAEEMRAAEEEVEAGLSVEMGADEDWATEDETEELTEPQLPASGLHPVPQWSVEAPQNPYWEQHSDLAPS
jgi:hypothetical protein